MLQFYELLIFEIFSSISTKLFEKKLAVSHVYNEVTFDIFRFLRTVSKFVRELDLRVSHAVYTYNVIEG
jgi:hypothetical protein